jgi:hypothetical protein
MVHTAKTLWANDFVNWGMMDSCYTYPIFDGCPRYATYIKGLGGPYYGCLYFFYSSGNSLVYYKKSTHSWGTPLVITSTPEIPVLPSFKIYPNPAQSGFTISSQPEKLPLNFELIDISGEWL